MENVTTRLFEGRRWLLTLSVLITTSLVGIAQQPESPLVGTPAQEDLPEGARLVEDYATFESGALLVVPGTEAAALSGPTISFAAAALVQSELPEGFTLREGEAVRVMSGAAVVARTERSLTQPPVGEMEDEIASQEQVMPEPAGAVGSLEKWFINYGLDFHGIPLSKGSDVLAVIGVNGQTNTIRRRHLPLAVDATEPTVTQEEAIDVVLQAAEATFAAEDVRLGEPELEIWVDAAQQGHLAWTFTVENESLTDPEARRYWVSAVGEPEVLNSENLIYHTHFGTVTGTYWEASPFGVTETLGLGDLTVTRGSDSQVTEADGTYGFTTGAGSATVTATLAGPYAVIENLAGTVMEQSGSGTPANPIDLNFGASDEFELAQVSAFNYSNILHDFAKDILSSPDLENTITRVNIDSSCNAFYRLSDRSVNFFRAGGSCPNTAYADVVHHELGHAIDDAKGGILDGGLSEGTGDAMTLLITRQPCVGRDIFGAGTCLRPATDVDNWPPGPGEGVHSQGKRFAQFTWNLVQELQKDVSEDEAFALASEIILAAIAGNPSDIPDAVMLSFIADDDDGNLSNGTPHFAALAAAADSRNIPRPPDPVIGQMGYVWANNPTADSYTPSATYAYNGAGGPITITRSGTGSYAVRFTGLGGGGTPGGHVQVTAYGNGSENCKVSGWSSSGSDFVTYIRCFDVSGNPANTRYTVFVTWPN